MATILSQVGWPVSLLVGGYKTYRRVVQARLYDGEAELRFVLLDGHTGSAKTEILGRLAARGDQHFHHASDERVGDDAGGRVGMPALHRHAQLGHRAALAPQRRGGGDETCRRAHALVDERQRIFVRAWQRQRQCCFERDSR